MYCRVKVFFLLEKYQNATFLLEKYQNATSVNLTTEQGEGGGGQCGVTVQSYTNVHNTLTERHAPPGFDPGHTGWEPTPLTTELSEPG